MTLGERLLLPSAIRPDGKWPYGGIGRRHGVEVVCVGCVNEIVYEDPGLCALCTDQYDLVEIPWRDQYGVQCGAKGWLVVLKVNHLA